MSAYDPRWKPPPKSGTITGAIGTIPATAGRALVLTATGSWGNLLTAQTVSLSYDGAVVATEPVASVLSLGARIPFALSARVTALASASAVVATSAGTLYDVKITWIEHSEYP